MGLRVFAVVIAVFLLFGACGCGPGKAGRSERPAERVQEKPETSTDAGEGAEAGAGEPEEVIEGADETEDVWGSVEDSAGGETGAVTDEGATDEALVDEEDGEDKFSAGEAEEAAVEVNEVNEVEAVERGGENAVAEVNEPNEVEAGEVNDVSEVAEAGEVNDVNEVAEAEEPDAGDEPNEANEPGRVTFHDKCSYILGEFVDERGLVDYGALRHKRVRLNDLLGEFEELEREEYESWGESDKIAFWINAYNICLLKSVLENYPIETTVWSRIIWGPYDVRNISGLMTEHKFLIMEEEFTCAAIEEHYFREEFDEPRALLALSHGTLSGPPLWNEPYYGYKLDEQLEEQARRFLSRSRGFKIDRGKGVVYLSVLLQPNYYGVEFLSRYGTEKKFKGRSSVMRAVLNFVSGHVDSESKRFLEVGNYSIEYLDYNWRLNDSSLAN